ncbi:ganglioside GM2 activator-like isoform X2 [Pithys albifrons albifrons]|uniref:ganglioside GM2 activator-like isoform X2 n=1 Tax=Pithys albifrons albifrons TaxID=3385563 RepID=UPI003A5CC050
MLCMGLALALCALQLVPAALAGPQPQLLVERSGARRLSKVRGFSWENCGPNDPVVVQSLSLSPDPIRFPGRLTVSARVSVQKNVTSPVWVKLSVKKYVVFFWTPLPCINNIGSCTYNDFCEVIDMIFQPGVPCPNELTNNGIPCHCPFKKGSSSLPVSDFDMPDVELPSRLTSVNYCVHVVLSNGGDDLTCLKMELSLKAK